MDRKGLRSHLGRLFFLAAATLTVYSFVLSAPFKTLDDDASIVRNDAIQDLARVPGLFTRSFFGGRAYYRPLVSLSYALEYRAFGLDPFFYYLDNILLHILTAFALWGFLRRIRGRDGPALAAAALFALHPVQWEAVTNVSGRAILLSAFFGIHSLRAFVLASGRPLRAVTALVCFTAALASKESAVVLPAVAWAYWFFLERKPVASRGSVLRDPRLRLIGGYLGILTAYILWRGHLGITALYHWRSPAEALLGFTTFLRGTLTYLRLYIWPVDLHFDRALGLFTSWTDPELIATLAVYLGAVWLLWRMRRRVPPVVRFLGVWALLELVPVSQMWVTIGVQPGSISLAEHFLYLPSAAVFALVALGGETLVRRLTTAGVSPAALRAAGAALGLALMSVTAEQAVTAADEFVMCERSLAIAPDNNRIRVSLAMAYGRAGFPAQAEAHFREVLDREPWNVRARIGLAKALSDQGRFWPGIAQYDLIADAGPEQGLVESNRRLVFEVLERRYRRLIAGEAGNARAYYSLAVVLSRMDRWPEAAEDYRRALDLDPGLGEAWFNLGVAYQKLGQPLDAVTCWRRFRTLPDADPVLRKRAAEYLAALGAPPGGDE